MVVLVVAAVYGRFLSYLDLGYIDVVARAIMTIEVCEDCKM